MLHSVCWVQCQGLGLWGFLYLFPLMVVKGLGPLPAPWLKAGGGDGPGSIPFYLKQTRTSPLPPPAHQPAAHFHVCNMGHLSCGQLPSHGNQGEVLYKVVSLMEPPI